MSTSAPFHAYASCAAPAPCARSHLRHVLTLYFGAVFTVVRNPKDELKTGTFRAMCAQLGIKPTDL